MYDLKQNIWIESLTVNNKLIALLDTDGTGGAVVQSVDQGHPTDPPHS